jgi:hypothetical protein
MREHALEVGTLEEANAAVPGLDDREGRPARESPSPDREVEGPPQSRQFVPDRRRLGPGFAPSLRGGSPGAERVSRHALAGRHAAANDVTEVEKIAKVGRNDAVDARDLEEIRLGLRDGLRGPNPA